VRNSDLKKKAISIIENISYITIATVSQDGQPWNSPVYTAFDFSYNFYWASWKKNIHSKNIKINEKIFIVIYDSTVPPGTGEGVYFVAKAHELTNQKEVSKGAEFLAGRQGKKPHKAQEYLGNYPRRMYKASVEKCWMNDDGEVDGNFVDVRIEVELLKKDL